jgi:hypothetical protein
MDNEYIKMCDVPEIQDRWEPKVGDRVVKRGLWEHDYRVIKVAKDGVWVDFGINGGFIPFVTAIYIPSIEDVLEWLTGYHFISLHQGSGDWQCERWGYDRMSCKAADTPLKALLKAYMHLEHGKEWTGETWK